MMDLATLAVIMSRASSELKRANHEILENTAYMFEDSAKNAIGNDAYVFGWPPLAESTIERKGFDHPLLETGELQASITHNVDPMANITGDAYVGTDNEKAAWQEFGTSRIPPRPFLGGAIMQNEHRIGDIVRAAIAKLFP